MMIAFTGTTIDRNTSSSRMKLSPSTTEKTIGVYSVITSIRSTSSAVRPVTSTFASVPPKAAGM